MHIRKIISRFGSEALALLAPANCKICGTALHSSETCVCAACLEKLPRTPYFRKRENEMTERLGGILALRRATALLLYERENQVSHLIREFKYYDSPWLARMLGEMLGRELTMTDLWCDVDVIMPVPIHFTKRMKRGYNQTELLARGVSKILDIPVDTSLRAVRPHSTQTHKSLQDRMKGASSALFRVRRPDKLVGKHILLIDDVCTTGATLRGVADALMRDIPGAKISIVTLAATTM